MKASNPIWVVGDVQGCDEPLGRLLAQPLIAQDLENPATRLWFAGDLVNRGPQSVQVLRRLRSLGNRMVAVLGNHDMHLLGVAAGVRGFKPLDTIQDVLDAPDADDLIDWLRQRPLAHSQAGHLMVHAGLWPGWSANDALEHAAEISALLRSDAWQSNIGELFGAQTARWDDSLCGAARHRVIVSALTRLRYCQADGEMALTHDMAPDQAPAGLIPWFEHPAFTHQADMPCVVFGHWSRLGLYLGSHAIGLDTGCVWGGPLTALRLQDRQVAQVARYP